MNIRQATHQDLNSLVRIAQAASPYAWSRQVMADCFKADYHIWLIESLQQQVQGFIVLLYQLDECQLLNICVDPEHQRQGLGYRLLKHAIEFARHHRVKRFSLEVRSSNTSAKSLYRSFGFIEVGLRKDYYPSHRGREDAHFFVLVL